MTPKLVKLCLPVLVATALLALPRQALSQDDGAPRLVVQRGHGGLIEDAVLSPDGRWIATAGSGGDAVLWEAGTGREVRRLKGDGGPLNGLLFTPDGCRLIAGSGKGAIFVWDVATGTEVGRHPAPARSVECIVWMPGGRRILAGGWEMAWVQDPKTGEVRSRYELGKYVGGFSAAPMAFSYVAESVAATPDGRRVLVTARDTVRLLDALTGEEAARLVGHDGRIADVAASPDGLLAATAGFDGTVRLWDLRTGEEVRTLVGHTGWVESVAFSPDGGTLLSAGDDGSAREWETSTGSAGRVFTPGVGPLGRAAYVTDGERVLLAGTRGQVLLLDARTGEETRRFVGRARVVTGLHASGDGRWLLVRDTSGTAWLWDIRRGGVSHRFGDPEEQVTAAAFSPSSERLLLGRSSGRITVHDPATSVILAEFQGKPYPIATLALSPDGSRLSAGTVHGQGQVWATASGVRADFTVPCFGADWVFSADGRYAFVHGVNDSHVVHLPAMKVEERFPKGAGNVSAAALSPDGRLLLTGPRNGTAELWELPAGKRLRSLEGLYSEVRVAAFSPDGRIALTGRWKGDVQLWMVATGARLVDLPGHVGGTQAACFTPDGSRVFTGGRDGVTRLWETASGREVCSLISFADGAFAVVDAEGRYDASSGGDVGGLHWVIENEAVSLDQLKERYYEPGLLAKHLGLSDEPLREVGGLQRPRLYPLARLDPPPSKEAVLGIHLTNRGGGIGRVTVRVNGKELTADARGPDVDPEAPTAFLEVDLRDDPRLVPGSPNVVEVEVYNREGYLRSRGLRLEFQAPGEPESAAPELWAVVCGVSDYRGEAIDLRYAAKDAGDFAEALGIGAHGLFGRDRAHITHLDSDAATREGLHAALASAAAARPRDVLVVYLSGHGVNFGGAEGDFYYLTREARSADLADPAVRGRVAVSSRELTEWVKRIPAQKQVLILDTCAAGGLIERLTEQRRIPGSQIRALERMKDRTGLFVLAGCAADRVSYEATRYAQGLLTHSLLMGMRGGALRENEFVDVSLLFGFAADRVPDLARDVGGVQRPLLAAPRGGASFDIGRLTIDDQARVPLRSVRPLFLRSLFQEEDEFGDPLRLARAVDLKLTETGTRGAKAPLVFVDASEFPDAYRIVGRYIVEGEKVRVRFRLSHAGEKSDMLHIEGGRGEVEALASRIVLAATGLLPR